MEVQNRKRCLYKYGRKPAAYSIACGDMSAVANTSISRFIKVIYLKQGAGGS